MTGRQFSEAIKLAKIPEQLPGSVSWAKKVGDTHTIDLDLFDGCALPGAHDVVCTIEDVAKLIKYNCIRFNGGWDYDELENVRYLARTKFIIVGDPIEERNKLRREARLEAKFQAERERVNEARRAEQVAADAARARVVQPVIVHIPAQPETVMRRIRSVGGTNEDVSQ